jgi:hypothetical protein
LPARTAIQENIKMENQINQTKNKNPNWVETLLNLNKNKKRPKKVSVKSNEKENTKL